MTIFAQCRMVVLAVAGATAGANGWGQGTGVVSSLPPMAATSAGSPASSGQAVDGRRGANRAEVEYTGGLLHVTANNASLNQILREVGRQTGMKITGGVQEDRVFGSYGPAPASEVLTSLLNGTSSNVLIVENESNGPAELILTPRHGGATPPNPNAASLAGDNYQPPQPVQQPPPPQQVQTGLNQPAGPPGAGGLPPSNGGQTGTPIDGGANLGSTPGAFAGFGQTPQDSSAQGAANPTSAGDVSQPQSPNGVSTPQQIYEQLQKLRQQQTANPQ